MFLLGGVDLGDGALFGGGAGDFDLDLLLASAFSFFGGAFFGAFFDDAGFLSAGAFFAGAAVEDDDLVKITIRYITITAPAVIVQCIDDGGIVSQIL